MCHGAAITKKRASPVPTRNSRQRRHSPVTARYIKAAPPGNASAIKPFVKTPSAIHAYPAYQRQESARDSRAVKKKYNGARSEEHTSELQSHHDLVCRLLLEKKKKK